MSPHTAIPVHRAHRRAPAPGVLDVPVLIAGAGPAGLAAATTLGRLGVECLVAEPRSEIAQLPRATGISTRTMEIVRGWGLEDAVRAGAPDVEWLARECTTLAGAAEGSDIEVGFPSRAQSRLMTPAPPACVAQERLERVLGEALDPGRLRRGARVDVVRNGHDGVQAVLRDGAGRDVARVRARYLIAADGVRGGLRDALGIGAWESGPLAESVGMRFRAPLWPVAGAHRSVIYFITHPEAAGALIPCGHDDRWVYACAWDPEREREADYDAARLTRLLRLAAGVPGLEPEIEWVGTTTFGAHLADRFRAHSAFLAGDAAHRVTPRGATGLNLAVHSGFDLGWKLGWVLSGWAGPELLDSYESERRPAAAHNVERGMDPTGSIRETGRELHADLGGRIPHVWLPGEEGRTSTLDLLGAGYTFFTGPDPVAAPAAAAPVAVRPLDATTARALGIRGANGLLVRPDGVPVPAAGWRLSQIRAESDTARVAAPAM